MDSQQLIAQLRRTGDALYVGGPISRKDSSDRYVPFEAHVYWPVPLVERALTRWGRAGLVLVPPALVIDLARGALLVLRWFVVWPVVALVCWGERKLAHRLGRDNYFCPLCCNPMKDPCVYCPKCRRVQPRLGSWSGLLYHTCECKQHRWLVPGRFLSRRPGPAVCRDTDEFLGCYLPHALPDELAGRFGSRHVAIAGTSSRVKHAVMASLFVQATRAKVAGIGQLEPAWDLSRLELSLFEALLAGGSGLDGDDLDRPGEHYVLAQSFILRPVQSSELLVFHNVPNSWLTETLALARGGRNWKSTKGLVFVLDTQRMGEAVDEAKVPQSEAYSRLVRVIEEFCSLRAGAQLPLRVAVVIPVFGEKSLGAKPEEYLKRNDPALHALMTRTVAPQNLRFWSGSVGSDARDDTGRTRWAHEVLEWVC
jgi:hypothetical protein